MSMELKLSVLLPVSQEKLYKAWLSSKEHGLFTGSGAKIDPKAGGKFTAWDGYIFGKTLELTPNSKIVQAWRTTDFAESDPDSRLVVLFEPEGTGTKLTFIHSEIPEGQEEEYRQGWIDYYFTPMKEYFGSEKK